LLELTGSDRGGTPSTKFWIKREDNNSGLSFGGNKIRKLEYVLPDALRSGATVLVMMGGLQSTT
jgi:1-aminocyclopropane-1-carboxylate deaminase